MKIEKTDNSDGRKVELNVAEAAELGDFSDYVFGIGKT